jgi:hypothetical protein
MGALPTADALPNMEAWAKRSGEAVSADAPDGAYLLSIREQKYFHLNVSGAAIWKRLESPVRLSQIRDGIAEEFAVAADQAGRAVVEYVRRLAEQKIVIVQSQPFCPD